MTDPERDDLERLAAVRLERLRALHLSAMAMNESHDMRLTLNVIVRQAAVHVGVSAVAIALLDRERRVLEYAGGTGFRRSGISRSRLAMGAGYLGRAALERRPLGIQDLSSASGFLRHDMLEGEDFVSYLAVPLNARGRLVGALELFHRARLEPDAEWLDFVETLAEQAAATIENARLRQELQRRGSVRANGGVGQLTQSEQSTLRLLASGCSNAEIAERLFVSVNTVKFHLRRIYRKLGVRTRTEAVVIAAGGGWI